MSLSRTPTDTCMYTLHLYTHSRAHLYPLLRKQSRHQGTVFSASTWHDSTISTQMTLSENRPVTRYNSPHVWPISHIAYPFYNPSLKPWPGLFNHIQLYACVPTNCYVHSITYTPTIIYAVRHIIVLCFLHTQPLNIICLLFGRKSSL